MESTRYNYIYPYEMKIRKKVQQAIESRENKMSLEERELLREIEAVYKEMAISLSHFNHVIEPELIEYHIYQYKAAQVKHGYLLRCMKELYYDQPG